MDDLERIVLKNRIDDLESSIADDQKAIEANSQQVSVLNYKIAELKELLAAKQKLKDSYTDRIEKYTSVKTTDSDGENTELGIEANNISSAEYAQRSSFPNVSKDYTFSILKENDRPDGMSIKDIIEKYKQRGLMTHDRSVNEHIRELKDVEKSIYQTNPSNQRGRKFRVVKPQNTLE